MVFSIGLRIECLFSGKMHVEQLGELTLLLVKERTLCFNAEGPSAPKAWNPPAQKWPDSLACTAHFSGLKLKGL